MKNNMLWSVHINVCTNLNVVKRKTFKAAPLLGLAKTPPCEMNVEWISCAESAQVVEGHSGYQWSCADWRWWSCPLPSLTPTTKLFPLTELQWCVTNLWVVSWFTGEDFTVSLNEQKPLYFKKKKTNQKKIMVLGSHFDIYVSSADCFSFI